MFLQQVRSIAVFALSLLALNNACAVDLDWSKTTGGPVFIYNDVTSWTPPQIPTDADNVTFSIDVPGTPLVFIAALSNGLNVNVLDNDWVFTSAGGSNLDTEGTVTIDDALGTALANGAILTVNAAVNWDTVLDLIVGDAGYGTFNLDADADFRGRNVYIGNQLGSVGVVEVDGIGTTLQTDGLNSGDGFIIGNAGTGTLNVTGGGLARIVNDTNGGIADFNLGLSAEGEGTLNIDGPGSSVIGEDVVIGAVGIGHLSITNGGVFDQNIGSSPDASVALNTGSSGDITVNGNGSEWRMARLEIGNLGDATLSVEAGGFVRSNSNDMALGDAGGSGRVSVFGAGASNSRLEVANDLYVGSNGLGVMRVGQDLLGNENGNGELSVGSDLLIGNNNGNNQDNQLVVSGASANVSVGDILRVGAQGKGSMSVLNGATVTNARGRIGELPAVGAAGTVTVDGANSSWDMTGDLIIGVQGGTGTLNITDGGFVGSDLSTIVGHVAGSRGTVLVSGANSQLAPTDSNTVGIDLLIGNSGTGDLTVEDGGFLFVETDLVMAVGTASNGRLIVRDAGSLATVGENPSGAANEFFTVGSAGRARVEILKGGEIQNERTTINHLAPDMAVFGESFTETFLISGVDDNNTPGIPGDDKASLLRTFGRIEVGSTREASLRIADGGQVISNDGIARGGAGDGLTIIGNSSTGDNSSVVITGAGSKWFDGYDPVGDVQSIADFVVANSSTGVTLDIEAGGALQTGRGVIARLAGSSADVTVTGTGSRWDATSFIVGNLATGTLTVSNGGTIESAGLTEVGNGATGNGTLTVTGANSSSTAVAYSVGDVNGAQGVVNVVLGGLATATNVFNVAEVSGATGVATIGTSSGGDATGTLAVGTNLNVGGNEGGDGGEGTLNVELTGVVNVSGNLKVFDQGTVNLNGGTINTSSLELVDPVEGPFPTFNFNSGTFRFTSNASLTAETLNDLLGPSPALIANQELDVVGTATLSAPLRINDGTLSVGSMAQASADNLDFDAGTFNLTNSGLVVTNTGLFGSNLVVDDNQVVNVTSSLFVQADGLLNVSRGTVSAGVGINSGTTVVAEGTASFGSSLTNNKTLVVIDSTINGDVINNGNLELVGNNTFTGNVSLSTLGSLSIDIGGTAPGEFDSLTTSEFLSIDGTLNVSLDGGFQPQLGDSFGILRGEAGFSGTFDTLNLPALNPGLSWLVNPGGITVSLNVVSSGATADFDGDGDVDGRDFLVWQRGNSPNGINSGDLALWQTQYGTTPQTASSNAVPEPGAVLLLGLGILALVCKPRRS